MPNTIEDFWEKVDITSKNECWNWTGSVDKSGFGKTTLLGKRWAHKIALFLHGRDAGDKIIKHTCNNKLCCNPHHMTFRSDSIWDYYTVDSVSGCWNWTGKTRGSFGYGMWCQKSAHRIAWAITNGEIPNGLFVLHKCDNPPCINPDHLFIGTQKQNMTDMISKGRKKPAVGEKNGNSKITSEQVLVVRELHTKGVRDSEISHQLGIGYTSVHQITRGLTWKSV